MCVLSAVCFGAMPVFGKFAYETGVSPDALMLVRFSLAAAVLGAILLVRPSLRRTPDSGPEPPRPAVFLTAFGLGAVGYAAQAGLYFSALRRMDASLLSLILYTYPVLVTVAAVLLGRDRLTAGRAAALGAASGGIVLVLLGTGGVSFEPVGACLAFGSAIVYTGYILVSDTVVRRLAPVLLAALVMTGAATTLWARAGVAGHVELGFGWRGWFWLACIAVVSTVLATMAFFAGLRRTGPSTTAILSTFEPVVTTALATVALSESLGPIQILGAVLVLSSAAILQARPDQRAGSMVPARLSERRATATSACWRPGSWPTVPDRNS